jgi:hypothetical protein
LVKPGFNPQPVQKITGDKMSSPSKETKKYLVLSEDFGSLKKGVHPYEALAEKKRIPEVARMVSAGKAKWQLLTDAQVKELTAAK